MKFFRSPAKKQRLALRFGTDPEVDAPFLLNYDGSAGPGGDEGNDDAASGASDDGGWGGPSEDYGGPGSQGGSTSGMSGAESGAHEAAYGPASGNPESLGGVDFTSRGAGFAYASGRGAQSAYDALTAAGFPGIPGNFGFAADSSRDLDWSAVKDVAKGMAALMSPLSLFSLMTDPNAGPADRASQASYDAMQADLDAVSDGGGGGETAERETGEGETKKPAKYDPMGRLQNIDKNYGTSFYRDHIAGQLQSSAIRAGMGHDSVEIGGELYSVDGAIDLALDTLADKEGNFYRVDFDPLDFEHDYDRGVSTATRADGTTFAWDSSTPKFDSYDDFLTALLGRKKRAQGEGS